MVPPGLWQQQPLAGLSLLRIRPSPPASCVDGVLLCTRPPSPMQALLAMTAALNTTPNALLTLGPKVAPVFTYHAITTPLLAADIPTGDTPYATLNTGLNLTVSKAANGSVVVRALGSDANVIRTDITAGGAVVHVIDSVLLPFFLSVASVSDSRTSGFTRGRCSLASSGPQLQAAQPLAC